MLLAVGAASAQQAVPRFSALVNDTAQVLQPSARGALESKLRAYQQRTGRQLALLTVPSLQGEPIEQFGLRVAEAWAPGTKARDDGLVMIVAVEDRQMRIEVGYGLEGAIPDVLASRIIRNVLTPAFQRGDFAGGIDSAFEALMRAADGEDSAVPAVPVTTQRREGLFGFAFMMLVFLLGLLSRVPRLIRAPVAGAAGFLLGHVLWGVLSWALLMSAIGVALGLLGVGFLPFGHRRHGMWGTGGGYRGGGFGGGGGGGFGGGGASGRW